MSQTLISLVAALGGALIGASASIATTWFQSKSLEKRHRARLAVETAMRDFQSAEAFAKFMVEKNKTPIRTYDLAYYLVLHTRLARLVESDDELTPDNWIKAHEAALAISAAGQKIYEKKRKAQQISDTDPG